eukprot:m.113114 g.113114  ORF g.113114 m.113114 type:complete len:84 (-) comp9127_c0_seq6:551-802(-)
MCGPLGCRAAGAAGCIDCAAGHELDPATTSCRDIDECRAFPCPDAMDCNNTAGSHSCYCQAPNRMVSLFLNIEISMYHHLHLY